MGSSFALLKNIYHNTDGCSGKDAGKHNSGKASGKGSEYCSGSNSGAESCYKAGTCSFFRSGLLFRPSFQGHKTLSVVAVLRVKCGIAEHCAGEFWTESAVFKPSVFTAVLDVAVSCPVSLFKLKTSGTIAQLTVFTFAAEQTAS